jgi:3-oxoacyl-[acyl-carrier protein] reductase
MTVATLTPPPWSLEGKTALVTGGSRGIGRGIAIHLVRKGVSAIAITYVGNLSAAEEVISELYSIGAKRAIVLKADILDLSVGPNLIPQVLKGLEASTLDIIVNNAAIVDINMNQPFTSTTADVFGKMMQGNVFGPMSIINASLDHLPPRGGRIINISSIASKTANSDPIMTYGASKAALDSITRSLAASFAIEKSATFNSMSVGGTRTDAMVRAVERLPESFVEEILGNFTAEKRLGEPEDVAYIVGFLASEEGRWINGANVSASGGNKYLLGAQG